MATTLTERLTPAGPRSNRRSGSRLAFSVSGSRQERLLLKEAALHGYTIEGNAIMVPTWGRRAWKVRILNVRPLEVWVELSLRSRRSGITGRVTYIGRRHFWSALQFLRDA